MDEIVESLAQNLNLTTGETDLLSADPAHAANPTVAHDLSLIGRVIIDRELPFNAIRANVLRLIHPLKGATLKSLGPNKFVMTFNHALDRKKTLGGCPWVLEKHALLFEPIDPSVKPEDQQVTCMLIVARILQISLANRSESIARMLGNKLGGFIEVPKDTANYYSSYLRIKVGVDVMKPLMRGLYFQGVEGKKQWLQVQYERLPVFCFICGILGHGEANCPTRYESDFVEPEGEFPFGSWMRAQADSRGPLSILSENKNNQSAKEKGWWGSGRRGSGSDSLGFNTRLRLNAGDGENSCPNIRSPRIGGIWREGHTEPSSSVQSGESQTAGARRRLRVPSHKRKAKDAALGDGTQIAKKAQPHLNEEVTNSAAETAEQSRRGQ